VSDWLTADSDIMCLCVWYHGWYVCHVR